MTARQSAKPTDRGGFLAQWSGECYRCGEPVIRNVSLIVFRRAGKGQPIHIECSSGYDDE